MNRQKVLMIGVLCFAFALTATAAFAAMTFNTDTISGSGVINLSPTGEPVTVNGSLNVGGDPGSPLSSFNSELGVTSGLILSSDPVVEGGPYFQLYEAVGDGSHRGPYTQQFIASGGTKSAPTAIGNDQYLGEVDYLGHDGTDFTYGAYEAVYTSEDWTPSAQGTSWYFVGNKNGETGAPTSFLEFEGDVGVTLGRTDMLTTMQGSSLAFTGASVFNSSVTATDFITSSGLGLAKKLSGTSAIDFGSIANAACANSTFTLTGAVTTDSIATLRPAGLADGMQMTAWVSATNTIKVQVCNNSGGPVDPASLTYGVTVVR